MKSTPHRWDWVGGGVVLRDDRLQWGAMLGDQGTDAEQSFADFLDRGALLAGVPTAVLEELTRAVAERVATDGDSAADAPPAIDGPSASVPPPAAGAGPRRWDWEDGWKTFSLALADQTTAVVRVAENDLVTNGHAGFPADERTLPLAALLADGPPAELVDQCDLAVLARELASACADLGAAPPGWLGLLGLHEAARSAPYDIVRKRFGRCDPATARVRVGGRDALYWALTAGRPDVVAYLLGDLGADPNAVYAVRSGGARTATMVAIRDGPEATAIAVLDALRAAAADLESRNDRGETPLLWLLGSAYKDGIVRQAAFDWLLRAGADPNARRLPPQTPHSRRPTRAGGASADDEPWTPLYALARSNFLPEWKFKLARQLFAAGATVAAMPEPLRDPFRAAFRSWDPAAAEVLADGEG